MKVHQLLIPNSYQNFNYIIEYSNNKALCIDPFSAEPILDFLHSNHLELVALINTHGHFDHIGGNEGLKQKTHCEVWSGEYTSIQNVNRKLKEGDKIDLDENSYLEIIYTPGHTHGHICLKLFEQGNLTSIFTGDTLFNAGVGNCTSGDVNILYETIKKHFLNLSNNVKIYPGHDYLENNCKFTLSHEPSNEHAEELINQARKFKVENKFLVTTIEDEKSINFFLRIQDNKVKKLFHIEDEEGLFLHIRQLRDRW